MIVYHASHNVEGILANGFKDGGGTYGTTNWWEGVWVSDRPLSCGDGGLIGDEPLLRIDVPESVLAEFEWVQDVGYREWLVPASIIKRYPYEFWDRDAEWRAEEDAYWAE